MRAYNIAVLSFAHIHAWSYARVLRELPNARLVAVYDDDEGRRKLVSERLGVKDVYDDYRELLRREDVDAVIITSENAKHADQAIAAAEEGKHILCEKPIATNLGDADEMLKAAERAGVRFQTAFVMRYHSAAVAAKKVIESGEIGELVAITATNHGKYPGLWFGDPELAGGGAVMDHTVHVADLMRWYSGDEAEQVYAEIGRRMRPWLMVEDSALIAVRFRRGMIGSIDCSWSRPEPFPIWGDVYLGILGTDGYLALDAFRSCVSLTRAEGPPTWEYFGCDCDKEMIRHFLRCLEEDMAPLASGRDGRQALEIALATYEASGKHGPVKLPL